MRKLCSPVVFLLSICVFQAHASGITVPEKYRAASKNIAENAKLKQAFTPRYPETALENGTDGTVIVAFVIASDGRAYDAQVLGGNNAETFRRETLAALRFWEFTPAVRKSQICRVASQAAIAQIDFRHSEKPQVRVSGLSLIHNPTPSETVESEPEKRSEQADYTEIESVDRFAPDYPAEAARKGIEGVATLEFTVGTDGTTKDFKVLQSYPGEIFDAEAIETIAQWEFQPATKNGKPIERRACQTLVFRLPSDWKYRTTFD